MKYIHYIIALFLALCTTLLSSTTYSNSLINDPFITQNTDRSSFEPGGKNHLFGSARGSVSEREGDIQIIPTGSLNTGHLSIDQAIITGKYDYKAKFSNHGHEVHAPFSNSNSRSKSDEQGQALIGFTSYKMDWQGTEVHPADAYDGPQGGGYPTPTGARDEYSYTVNGSALSVNINFNDPRNTADRLKDRANAFGNAWNNAQNAYNTLTTHNPNLSGWGNMFEGIGAVASGIGGFVNAPFDALGASDIAQGASLARDLAALEAMRAMPQDARMTTADAMMGVNDLHQGYQNWKTANPNAGAVADAVGAVAGAVTKGKGGDSNQATGDKITGPNGGQATDTGHTTTDGQPIYQRESGGYYSQDPNTGMQRPENSPYPHGNTLNEQPTQVYRKYDGEGNFQKNGISNTPNTRYDKDEMAGGTLDILGGNDRFIPRNRGAAVERFLTERNPGPDNKEPWAGKANPNHPNYDPTYVPMHKRKEQ